MTNFSFCLNYPFMGSWFGWLLWPGSPLLVDSRNYTTWLLKALFSIGGLAKDNVHSDFVTGNIYV